MALLTYSGGSADCGVVSGWIRPAERRCCTDLQGESRLGESRSRFNSRFIRETLMALLPQVTPRPKLSLIKGDNAEACIRSAPAGRDSFVLKMREPERFGYKALN